MAVSHLNRFKSLAPSTAGAGPVQSKPASFLALQLSGTQVEWKFGFLSHIGGPQFPLFSWYSCSPPDMLLSTAWMVGRNPPERGN